MTDERDEILDELRQSLAIEPSPDFEARVRMAVAETTPRRVSWTWVAAGLSVAVVLVAVALRPRASESDIEPTRVAVAPARQAQPAIPSAPSVVIPEPLKGRVLAPRRLMVPMRVAREPEVLVPPDQAIALQRLVAGVREGRVVLAPSTWMEGPVVVPPLPEIEPILIEELVVSPAADGARAES